MKQTRCPWWRMCTNLENSHVICQQYCCRYSSYCYAIARVYLGGLHGWNVKAQFDTDEKKTFKTPCVWRTKGKEKFLITVKLGLGLYFKFIQSFGLLALFNYSSYADSFGDFSRTRLYCPKSVPDTKPIVSKHIGKNYRPLLYSTGRL